MKIQCNACEAAEAKVICCADEAALCFDCDQRVHAANKLAGKHQRVPLIDAPSPSRLPKCDICQEASGYFFCLEDRALLCRSCDVSIHTANCFVSAHRRYLVTGVQVGLEPTEALPSISKGQSNSTGRVTGSPSKSPTKGSSLVQLSAEANQVFSSQASKDGYLGQSRAPYSEVNMIGSLPDWSVDDLFGFTDFNQNYGFPEHVSSKTDSGKLGSSEGSPRYFAAEFGLDCDESLGQVPEISHAAVPDIPSPPTASGLHWQKDLHYLGADNAVFVPDISSYKTQGYKSNPKRRRAC